MSVYGIVVVVVFTEPVDLMFKFLVMNLSNDLSKDSIYVIEKV